MRRHSRMLAFTHRHRSLQHRTRNSPPLTLRVYPPGARRRMPELSRSWARCTGWCWPPFHAAAMVSALAVVSAGARSRLHFQTTTPITPLPRVSCPRRAVSRPPLSTGWFRGMLEASAGLATQSVFMEGDSVFDPRTQVCDTVDCGPSRHRIVAAPTSTSLSRRMSRHADGLATAAGFACNVYHATCAAESNLNVVEYFPGTGPRRPEPARRPGGRQDAFSLCVRRQDNAAHPRDGGQVGFSTTIHPQPLSSQQLATPCVAPSITASFLAPPPPTLPFQGCV